MQRANELAGEILDRIDPASHAETINPDLYRTDNYESNTTGESGTYSPIKLGNDRLHAVGDNSVVEEGIKAIERLRIINAIEPSNDVINYELDN